MRTTTLVIVASIVFYYSNSSSAYDAERAINNMAHDFAICSAYFAVVSAMNGAPEDLKASYKDQSKDMYLMAVEATNEKSATARAELAASEMAKELDGKAENWSILINEYGELCKSVSEKPKERFEYWLNKEE